MLRTALTSASRRVASPSRAALDQTRSYIPEFSGPLFEKAAARNGKPSEAQTQAGTQGEQLTGSLNMTPSADAPSTAEASGRAVNQA